MNTKTGKTNNGNTKGEPKSFTPQEVECSVLKALAPALEARGGSVHSFRLSSPGHGMSRFIPGPASEYWMTKLADGNPRSFLGLITAVML